MSKGLTLIELLVALLIFSILMTMTSGSLRQVFNVNAHLKQQSRQLRTLQFTMSLLQRDSRQALDRPVRGDERRLFPGFVGEPAYIEFTRGGQVHLNPDAKESSLLRVAYVCSDHQLIRRIWLRLDPVSRAAYEDEIVLEHLQKCRFAFLNAAQQILPTWHQVVSNQGQSVEALPRAVQMTLASHEWGESTYLFMVAGGGDENSQSAPSG